jgi:hypothetical protein
VNPVRSSSRPSASCACRCSAKRGAAGADRRTPAR